ncbi:hypothetical protein D9615_002147 [Tricholomella constricta]|uniref:Uncharacterized protein n=1 Tax=Tricholomella constricta TaxID=117010 RepID=A0A8H5HNE9_9AGAR|nr:hypothetical protein D9615_002147 [Tricholomella constricta]
MRLKMVEHSEQFTHSIVSLIQDLFALKLYWVAVSSLWLYDYALTLDDEIEYALSLESSSCGSGHLSFAPVLAALPTTGPYYHVCIFMVPAEAFLCLCLGFDYLAFVGIIFGIALRRTEMNTQCLAHVATIIRRDGVLYFFVLFSSKLLFLLMQLHARPGLKLIHNQPAMVISAIMVNRITLNLKRESHKQLVLTRGTKTFLPVSALHSKGKSFHGIELEAEDFSRSRRDSSES